MRQPTTFLEVGHNPTAKTLQLDYYSDFTGSSTFLFCADIVEFSLARLPMATAFVRIWFLCYSASSERIFSMQNRCAAHCIDGMSPGFIATLCPRLHACETRLQGQALVRTE